MNYLYCSVIKFFASFAVKWCQLQKNIICTAVLKIYMKINVVFLKGR